MYKVLLHNAIPAENVHTPNITSTLDEIILKMKSCSVDKSRMLSSCTEKRRRSQVVIEFCFKVMDPYAGLIGSSYSSLFFCHSKKIVTKYNT